MKLVFIHGAPATGKLTVATELLRLVAGRLFDNHAAIDFAKTLFDFGAPGFWELVHEARVLALGAAARNKAPLIVMTFCYSHPDDLASFEQFEAQANASGGELLPVYLHCCDQDIARRISAAERVERRKLSSLQAVARFRESYHDAPVPRDNCLRLDTGAASAPETARAIARHFCLPAREAE